MSAGAGPAAGLCALTPEGAGGVGDLGRGRRAGRGGGWQRRAGACARGAGGRVGGWGNWCGSQAHARKVNAGLKTMKGEFGVGRVLNRSVLEFAFGSFHITRTAWWVQVNLPNRNCSLY